MNGLNQLIAQGVQFKAPPDPFEQYGRMQQLEQGQQANMLNQLKMQEYQRGIQEQNQLHALDSESPDYLKRVGKINPKLMYELGKLQQEAATGKLTQQKTQIENFAARKKLEQQAKRDISQNPSDAQVTAYIEDVTNSGLYSDAEKAESQAELKQLLAIPYEERKALFASQGATAGELKPTQNVVDTGQAKEFWQTGAFGGKPTMVSSAKVTVDPNTLANNATSRSNNAASIAAANQRNAETINATKKSDAKPTYDGKANAFVYPPSTDYPQGRVVPMNDIAKNADQQGAIKALSSIGYDPITGVDKVSELIKKSTSGDLERSLAYLIGAGTGSGTTGAKAIGQLKPLAATFTLDLLNGKLGAGISNADREFILEKLGAIADPSIPSDVRLEGWNQAMSIMKQNAGIKMTQGKASGPVTDATKPASKVAPPPGFTPD